MTQKRVKWYSYLVLDFYNHNYFSSCYGNIVGFCKQNFGPGLQNKTNLQETKQHLTRVLQCWGQKF
jgi:hypothetical protein